MRRPTVTTTAAAAVAAALTTLSASLGLASPAHAAKVNTFQGHCSGSPALVEWSEPLRTLPALLSMEATVDGGTCSGRVNGRRIAGAPLHLEWRITGPQACSVGRAQGRTWFRIAGRVFTGTVRYQRGGVTPAIYIDADTSGYAVSLARALAEPEDVQACAEEGIKRTAVLVESLTAPVRFSSPDPTRSRKLKDPRKRDRSGTGRAPY